MLETFLFRSLKYQIASKKQFSSKITSLTQCPQTLRQLIRLLHPNTLYPSTLSKDVTVPILNSRRCVWSRVGACKEQDVVLRCVFSERMSNYSTIIITLFTHSLSNNDKNDATNTPSVESAGVATNTRPPTLGRV